MERESSARDKKKSSAFPGRKKEKKKTKKGDELALKSRGDGLILHCCWKKLAISDRSVQLYLLILGYKTTLTDFSMPSFEHCAGCSFAAPPPTLFCRPDALWNELAVCQRWRLKAGR